MPPRLNPAELKKMPARVKLGRVEKNASKSLSGQNQKKMPAKAKLGRVGKRGELAQAENPLLWFRFHSY